MSMDDEELIEAAARYAAKHGVSVGERLGFGIHGRVCLLLRKGIPVSALKVFREPVFFQRERDAYLRLRDAQLREIEGCALPQLIACDDDLQAVEMTLVSPPYVLDFASVQLDWPPEFSDEIWEERTAKWIEEFGDDWPKVQAILAELEELRLYMLDPSPNNIRLR